MVSDTSIALSPPRKLAIMLTGAYAWLTGMVLPGAAKYPATLLLLGVLALIAVLSLGEQLSRKVRPAEAALAALLVLLFIVIALFSPYGVSELSQTMVLVAACLFVFHGSRTGEGDTKPPIDIVYWASVGALSLALVAAWRSGDFVVLSGLQDKNYSAILLFLFFSFCMKRGYRLGILLSVAYLIVDPSRVYILMMVVFWLLRLFKKRILALPAFARLLPLRPRTIVVMFVLMLIAVVVGSPLWAGRVVGPDTAAYRTSLNDTSNAMRAFGNIYGISRIASDPAFLVYGYDDETLGALGVASQDRQLHAQYNSYRLVQPHHSVLNLILKYGGAFTVVYLILLAWLLSPYLDARNLEYWVPYFIATLFMHSLLSGYLLVLWMYVLSVNEGVGRAMPVLSEARPIGFRGSGVAIPAADERGWSQ